MILNFFNIKVLKKAVIEEVLCPFKKEFRFAEIIKIKRNTTRIFLF